VDRALKRASQATALDEYGDLFAALPGSDVFFSCVSRGEDWDVEVRLAEDGRRVLPLFTHPDHPRIVQHFAGMKWEDTLRMIMNMPDVDGVVIRNARDEQVILAREALRALYLTFLASSRSASLTSGPLMPDEMLVICGRHGENSPFGRLMTYVIDGESAIPIFFEEASFQRQTEGSGYEDQGVVMSMDILAPLLADDARLILNPGDPDPLKLTKAELADALANGRAGV
jgi:hypothetical protein